MNKLKKSDKKTILSLSWRDIRSSKSGGAEVHTHKMLSRIDKSKYRVIHISVFEKDFPAKEMIDGVMYLRKGNAITVIIKAWLFYLTNRKNIDIVIDQCNTHRFFTPFWVNKKKRVFYIHQLTREIWDINARFPFNVIGKASENMMLRLNRHDDVITVSEDTKRELVYLGFDGDIRIIHNGVSFTPWDKSRWLPKEENPTFIYVGRYSAYKGINVAIEALGKIKKDYPSAKLWILGKKDEEFINRELLPVCKKYSLKWGEDIIPWGFVSEEEKLNLLSRAHALVFPSIREGWGIPVTEAGCVGTPCIAFNSPGIAEAVDYGKAGYLCDKNDSDTVAGLMRRIIENETEYDQKRNKAYEFSSGFTWDKSGKDFEEFMDSKINK